MHLLITLLCSTGFCVGFVVASPPVYIAEISESTMRGMLSSFSQVMPSAGVVLSFILGSVVSWQWLAIASAFCPFLFMISVMAIPESPRFLLDAGEVEEATAALCWLRGTNEPADVQDEIRMVLRRYI